MRGTASVAIPAIVSSLKIAGVSAIIGGTIGAGGNAIKHRVSSGSWKGAGKAALQGFADGFSDGFMWGGITAGATFATAASKGAKIKEIGRLKPSNKKNSYLGVKYEISRKGKMVTKSIELHSPHKNSSRHNVWHWQWNRWKNTKVKNTLGKWRIWGKKLK